MTSIPEAYTRSYDFQSYQSANPTRPLPGDKVNTELNAIATSMAEIVAYLQDLDARITALES